MDLHLTFAEGTIDGAGNDDVGVFLILGRYNAASGECDWTKTYPGSHDVYYRGFREGKGIWGTWEIGLLAHGGFHIWPKGEAKDEIEAESKEASSTVDDQTLAEPLERTLEHRRPSREPTGTPPTGGRRRIVATVNRQDDRSLSRG